MKLTPAKVTMLMLVAVGSLIGLYVIKGLFAVEKRVERPRTVNIPLATALLTPGTKLTDTHIGLGPYPVSELKEDTLRSARVVVARVVKGTIKPGSPIRGSDLYEPGENAPLNVAEGKKAVSITVKDSSEVVDGLIKPGDYVDVHFVLDAQGAAGLDPRLVRLGGLSKTLFKGVKVLALNKNFHQGPLLASGNSVTLELGPNQANVLLVARSRGTISLTFSPDGEAADEIALSHSDQATLWEILGLKKATPKPVVKPEEPEKPFVTETYRGVGGGSMHWGKDGRRWDNQANGTGNLGFWRGTNSGPDVSTGNTGGTDNDDFDPDDVFEKPGIRSGDIPSQGSAPAPASDPDIPMAQPGTASGVRSRVGSMLRARPKSITGSTAGPTALRN